MGGFFSINWVIVTSASALYNQTLEMCTGKKPEFVTSARLRRKLSHVLKDCMNPRTRSKPYKSLHY